MDPTDPYPLPLVRVERPDRSTARAVRMLLADTYWCADTPAERLERAILHSTVVVVARGADGEVVGAARALSDHARRAMIFDVIVAPDHRRLGLGRRIVATLLADPALADVAVIWLATRDRRAFYEHFGFEVLPHANPRPDGNVEMVRRRA